MSYTVKSSEKLAKSAADAETRALLYLMNYYVDGNDIFFFVIDFFNDVTGLNRTARELWDLQSKGAKNNSPNAIGKALVTLYKNYISDIDFKAYILFLGGVTGTFREDESQDTFRIDNVKEKARKKLIEGLKEECQIKSYISKHDITNEKLNAFLQEVIFVVDTKSTADYVKPLIGRASKIVSESLLEGIFNEIRDTQASKKHISVVEGVTIDDVSEALGYCRHLTSDEIKLFVLQRIINYDFLNSPVPTYFIDICKNFPPELRTEKIEQCQAACCRALFNKNCSEGYWKLFELVYTDIINNRGKSVSDIYNDIPDEILSNCPDLDALSFKFFISAVKGGVA